MFVDVFDDSITDKKTKDKMKDSFDKCLEFFEILNKDYIEKYEVLGVERKISTMIGDTPFTGYIDLLIRKKDTGEIILIDHKSSGYPLNLNGTVKNSKQKQFEGYKKQMYVYSKWIIETYGTPPSKIIWNHFKDSKIAEVKFDRKEFEDTISWCKNLIKKINKDVTFEPNKDFFFCSQLCSYRECCEYREKYDWRKHKNKKRK